jgi:hypothetical protein
VWLLPLYQIWSAFQHLSEELVYNIDSLIRGSGLRTPTSVRENVFLRNHAGGAGRGGAVVLSSLSGTIVGNTFFQNSQEIISFGGGTIHSEASTVDLDRNIIAGSAGAAVRRSSGTMNSSCNVFWDNPDGHVSGFELDPTDRIVDPAFCDTEKDDFHLMAGSPCLPEFRHPSVHARRMGASGRWR